MGLDTTHNCWSGAYGAFMKWRTELAKAAGLPPLELMEGFYTPLSASYGSTLEHGAGGGDPYWRISLLDEALPISWECLKPSPLHELLNHSDCDGEIPWESCSAMADALESLIPKLPSGDAGGHIRNWRDKTATFVAGLRLAAELKENVEFH